MGTEGVVSVEVAEEVVTGPAAVQLVSDVWFESALLFFFNGWSHFGSFFDRTIQ